eukprot:1921407-Prymnesium_polylepis.1
MGGHMGGHTGGVTGRSHGGVAWETNHLGEAERDSDQPDEAVRRDDGRVLIEREQERLQVLRHCEMEARCRRDGGEMEARWRRDAGEMQARWRRGGGE